MMSNLICITIIFTININITITNINTVVVVVAIIITIIAQSHARRWEIRAAARPHHDPNARGHRRPGRPSEGVGGRLRGPRWLIVATDGV